MSLAVSNTSLSEPSVSILIKSKSSNLYFFARLSNVIQFVVNSLRPQSFVNDKLLRFYFSKKK